MLNKYLLMVKNLNNLSILTLKKKLHVFEKEMLHGIVCLKKKI